MLIFFDLKEIFDCRVKFMRLKEQIGILDYDEPGIVYVSCSVYVYAIQYLL